MDLAPLTQGGFRLSSLSQGCACIEIGKLGNPLATGWGSQTVIVSRIQIVGLCLQCVAILNQDSFYRELSEEEKRNVHGDCLCFLGGSYPFQTLAGDDYSALARQDRVL